MFALPPAELAMPPTDAYSGRIELCLMCGDIEAPVTELRADPCANEHRRPRRVAVGEKGSFA
jgi:hypothetical protein